MARLTPRHLRERETELDELGVLIGGATAGAGRLVIVEGAAGAGKSALVAAAADHAAKAGVRVLAASGSELERDFAFGAIRQLFEPVLAGAPAAGTARLLAGAAAPAEWVVAPRGRGDASLPRAQAGFAAVHAVYWLATNVAVETPLLIAVDDLHWVDESSVRSLDYLARRLADLPIGLLVALRPEEPGAPAELLDELRRGPAATTVALHALGAGAVAELVRARVPSADDDLCAAFATASGGNPLYLQELLRTLAVNGGLDHLDATETVREASVPSVGDRVARRIARVSPEAPALATAMAVLGDGGSLRLAAALGGVDEDAAASVARRLRRIEVLAGEDPFAFVHPLVRRSVYDDLSVTERDAAHAAAADLLRDAGAPTDAIAAHLSLLRPSRSVEVVAALVSAAREALSRAAPEAAIRWLRRALAEEAPQPPRAALLFELGQAEMAVRDPASVDHLREALALAAEPDLRARIALALTELLIAAGAWEAGNEIGTAAVGELGDRDPELVVELETIRAAAMAHDPRLVATFEDNRERLEELATGDGWAAHALTAMLACVSAIRGEEVERVAGRIEHALGDGLLLSRAGGGWAGAQVAGALGFAQEYERALALSEEILAEGRRSGALVGVLTGVGYRGHVHDRRGELIEAETELRTILDLVMASGMGLWITAAFYLFAEAILERPSLDDVAQRGVALELEPRFLSTASGSIMLEFRGRLALARGDRSAAVADLRVCAGIFRPLGYGPLYSSWRSALALALPPEQRPEAMSLVAEELALARATGLRRPCGVALRAAGLLEGGEPGIALLRESAALLEDSDARLDRARTLVALGAALRRRQRRAEAREHLAAGMELAHRCGAVRLRTRAEEELRAAGARPRRATRSGLDALTASELRVARLAAEGATNPEIAQGLYVSLKTVETHLSHAYAKLGLAGQGARRGLAASLAEAEEPRPRAEEPSPGRG